MPVPPPPPPPRYGSASLADLVPALLGALDGGGDASRTAPRSGAGEPEAGPPRLGLPCCTAACLLLVDGLGARLLAEHADDAPTLSGLAHREITTGFPSTTAVSVASIGTGLPPGGHGLVGYQMVLPGAAAPLHLLRWTSAGHSVLETLPPEVVQPHPTAFERARVPVTVVGPPYLRGSGLTRAALRGARLVAAFTPADLVVRVLERLAGPGLVYAYLAELDTTGHVHGPGSAAWRLQLRLVDHLVAELLARLPPGALLAVTGDHGMVPIGAADRVDLDAEPDLRAGLRLVAGEPRARHLYARPGAAADVRDTWRERLGDRAWVLLREEAVGAGWFGPRVEPEVAARVGDVVVAAAVPGLAVVASEAEPNETRLAGHHGSLTPAELLVPLLTGGPALVTG